MILYRYNPILHRIALLTACATFPLIFMGGLVTSHGAGMSVPDWPNSYGYNMWLFPPSLWWNQGGIFYEHSHRLMATVVGLCAIVLAAAAWRMERRAWVRRLAYLVLGFVIFQGVLGGLRVLLVKLNLAIVHGITAQAFFCVAALAAMTTSKWWNMAPNLAWSEDYAMGRKLVKLSVTATTVVFLQLIVGAVMRHQQAGLAIPDVPLAYGHLLPPMTASQLQAVNSQRAFNLNLDPVTLTQVWLHFAHRLGAVAVSIATIRLAVRVFRRHAGQSKLYWPAVALCALLAVQVTLGIVTVLDRKPADIASLHVATGALLLLTCFTLMVRAMRLYSRRFRVRSEPVRVEVRSVGISQFLAS